MWTKYYFEPTFENYAYCKKSVSYGIRRTKKKNFNIFKSDEYFWNAGGMIEELRDFVKKAKSFKELLVYLSDEYCRK